jgi:very-short-patch-repair endonuclease
LTLLFNWKSQQEKRRKLRNNMTKAEVLLWLRLKSKQLGVRFLRQFGVGVYVLDFYSPAIKLAIEVDGATHLTPEQIEYDISRQSEIENAGIVFLRFTNQEIFEDLDNVLEKIKIKIEELKK